MSFVSALGGSLGGASLGAAVVSVAVDTTALKAGLAEARAEVEAGTASGGKLGTSLKSIASSAALPAAAGLALVGAASVKMALDYENAFTRIDAISNASSAQIAQWKDQVLSLAGETAQAPKDLADALYYLASAGLKTSDVMPVLEGSAKLAATGLGSITDIAKLTAQSLNAYASSGLTAAQAQDALFVAVRESTAAPEEFATALGRVLPIAAAAKVSFDQVVGSLGALSNIGLDVNEGTTALRGLLQAIVAPGSKAAEELNNLGLSADQLRSTLSSGGILAALKLLNDASNGNIDSLVKLIPNVRALTGELGLTGQNADAVAAILQRTADSAGAAAAGFKATTEGPGFQFKQFLAELQVQGVRLGEALLPLAGILLKITSALVKLGPVIFAVVAALIALKVASVVAAALTGLSAVLAEMPGLLGATAVAAQSTGLAMASAAGPIAEVAVALALVATSGHAATNGLSEVTQAFVEHTAATELAKESGLSFADALQIVQGKTQPVSQAFADLSQHVSKTGKTIHNFAGLTNKELGQWEADTVANFGSVGDVLTNLADKAHLTAQKVITAFRQQINAQKDYLHDLATLKKDGREVPDAVAQAFADMGLDTGQIIHVLATSSKRDFGSIIRAAKDTTDLAGKFPGAFEKVGSSFDSTGNHVDTLNNKLDATKNKLDALTAHTWNINVFTKVVTP